MITVFTIGIVTCVAIVGMIIIFYTTRLGLAESQCQRFEAFVQAHDQKIAEMENIVLGYSNVLGGLNGHKTIKLTEILDIQTKALDQHRTAIKNLENDLTEFMLHEGLKFDWTPEIPEVPAVPAVAPKRVIVWIRKNIQNVPPPVTEDHVFGGAPDFHFGGAVSSNIQTVERPAEHSTKKPTKRNS